MEALHSFRWGSARGNTARGKSGRERTAGVVSVAQGRTADKRLTARASRCQDSPAVARAGVALSLVEGTASRSLNSAHLATIATENTLAELRPLGIYIQAVLPDIARQTHAEASVVEHAYTTTSVHICSTGEKTEAIPDTYKEAMTLPAKEHWKAASDIKWPA